MKTKVLNVGDLERLVERGCSNPGCTSPHTELFVHANCHPEDGVDVCYKKGSSRLLITCRTCHKYIVEIAVGLV